MPVSVKFHARWLFIESPSAVKCFIQEDALEIMICRVPATVVSKPSIHVRVIVMDDQINHA